MSDTTVLILSVMVVLAFVLMLLFWLTRILLKRGKSRTETESYTRDKAYNALKFTEKIIEASNVGSNVKNECYEKLRSAKNAYARGQYTITIELTDDIKSRIRGSMDGNRNSG
ncbi:MAG: hypothetical protein N3F63_04760 [Thermoplasmata archaeon]|nr:hypothetical protein [Thermoplasmata archaeon]